MQFDWDPANATVSAAKHGVTFEEARSAFDDPLFLAFGDPDHSEGELRFILLGQSNQNRLLVVS